MKKCIIKKIFIIIILILFKIIVFQNKILAQKILPPEDFFGFMVGADYHLINYKQAIEYWKKLESLSENIKLSTEFNYFIHNIDNNSNQNNNASIPYLEDYSIPIEFSFSFPKSFFLIINSTIVSTRKINTTSNEKLKGYNLITIKAGKRINRYLHVNLEVINIGNNHFQRWQNFREFGTQYRLGLKSKW